MAMLAQEQETMRLMAFYPGVFADRLRRIRYARGLSQTEVAARAEINLGNYNEMEQGKKTAGANGRTLCQLCNVLEVSADYLLGLSEDATPGWRRQGML